ncbi:hypothetical protein LINPERHAP1_LOCUS24777 [Linum perenne]
MRSLALGLLNRQALMVLTVICTCDFGLPSGHKCVEKLSSSSRMELCETVGMTLTFCLYGNGKLQAN